MRSASGWILLSVFVSLKFDVNEWRCIGTLDGYEPPREFRITRSCDVFGLPDDGQEGGF